MIRLSVVALMLINTPIHCFSQKQEAEFSQSVTLRTNPFSFTEIDAGFMFGVKYQFSRQFAASLDPMFIFYNPYNSHHEQPLGIKIRSDIRYYLDKYKPSHDRFFIAPELHFKYVSTKKTDDFGVNCIGGQCSYYMNAVYREVKNETGGSLKLGTEIYLDKKNIWSFEFYAGFGIKVVHYSEKDIPFGGSFVSLPTHEFIFREDAPIPIFPAFIKLSFRIW